MPRRISRHCRTRYVLSPSPIKKAEQFPDFSSAQEGELDKQGRILISAPLREHADLTKDVVLVGVGNHIEIWSKDRYEASEASMNVDDVAFKLEELGLSL